MTRNRLNLRTRPVEPSTIQRVAKGRDPFDTHAFTAATKHPWELDGATPACAVEDPELFWPATAGDAERAKTVCRGCPLIDSCLAVAQRRREWGVWGGELLAKGRPTTDLPGNVREQARTA